MTNEINQERVNLAAEEYERSQLQNPGIFSAFKAGAAWQFEQGPMREVLSQEIRFTVAIEAPGTYIFRATGHHDARVQEVKRLVPRFDPAGILPDGTVIHGNKANPDDAVMRMLGSIENRLMEMHNGLHTNIHGLGNQAAQNYLNAMKMLEAINKVVVEFTSHKSVCDRDAILAAVIDVGQKVEAVLDQVTATDDVPECGPSGPDLKNDPVAYARRLKNLDLQAHHRALMEKIEAANVSDEELEKMGDRPVLISETDKAAEDLMRYGSAFMRDGKRVDPSSVFVGVDPVPPGRDKDGFSFIRSDGVRQQVRFAEGDEAPRSIAEELRNLKGEEAEKAAYAIRALFVDLAGKERWARRFVKDMFN